VLSPAFLGKFRMKNSYNRNFLSHLDREGFSTLTPYSSFNFGTRYQFGILNNVNMYIEAGSQMLISPGSISSEKLNFGGYGLVGVEYFLSENANRNLSVFIELGGTGNNSRADKLLTKPKIATGSTLSVGFQYSIKMNK
jgi:hypothetical protein